MERDSQQSLEVHSFIINRYQFMKRLFDIIVSAILLVCCIPLFLILALLIAISSGWPVIFTQMRTGKNNQTFTILKFRSMKRTNDSDNLPIYDWKDGVPDNFIFKQGFDPKVTPVGKYLRKYSLDEIPQLINVLLGNMSMVGPRPEIPEITRYYNLQQRKRLRAKPGLTGYAQVNGRSEIDHGKKIEYDLYYVQNQSFLLDMKILLSTVKLVVKGKGAF